MPLNNSLYNGVKEARTNSGEGLSPGKCPVIEQRQPSRHQTNARKKWTKENDKFTILCYLKAKEESLACQPRSISKTKKLSEVEIEALRLKVTTPPEPVEVLIKNDPIEGSDVTPVIESEVEQNHPATDGSMEVTHELHQNNDTQRISRMMQENSSDPIPSLRGIDALKVESTVSEINDSACNIRVKHSDQLKNLLRATTRLVCANVAVISNKK